MLNVVSVESHGGGAGAAQCGPLKSTSGLAHSKKLARVEALNNAFLIGNCFLGFAQGP